VLWPVTCLEKTEPAVPANLLQTVVSGFVAFFEWFGELGLFCGRVARASFGAPWEFREFVRQMDAIGSNPVRWWRSPERPPAWFSPFKLATA
jgi:hypothetical protein